MDLEQEKKKQGRPNSEDVAVPFPMKVPQSLKEKYDLMSKEVKANIRKEMVDKLRDYKK